MPKGLKADEALLAEFLDASGQFINPNEQVASDATAQPETPDVTAEQTETEPATPETSPVPLTPAERADAVRDIAGAFAARTQDRLATLPTPGGLTLLVVILLAFIWIAVPVNEQGHTRAYLLWLTLLGRTRLKRARDVGEEVKAGIGAEQDAAGGGGTSYGPDAQQAGYDRIAYPTNGQVLDFSEL